jgi:glycosyltransferase involved in cell wall biosynthesis
MASYTRLVMLGTAPETRSSIAAVVEVYRAHGLFKRWPVEYLSTHGGGGALRDAALVLDALKRFALLLAQHGRMLVHMHLSARGSALRDGAFIAAALAARCPLLVQLHGAGFERSSGALGLRRALEHAACVLTPCESLRSWVLRVARGAHTVCLPNPVACEVPPQPSRPNLVLFLGRMEPAKGIYDLLEAIATLRASIPDVRLVCAGDGDRVAVAHYAERLGIAEAVKFTGWVGPSGKRALFEAAAAFALPSYEAGLPVSLLEAMAAGVPVVACAVGGIPEVVVDGVSGFLVAPGDKARLERALRRLLCERGVAGRIGAAGRESARLRFAPERALPQLEEIYASFGLQGCGAQPTGGLPNLRRAA